MKYLADLSSWIRQAHHDLNPFILRSTASASRRTPGGQAGLQSRAQSRGHHDLSPITLMVRLNSPVNVVRQSNQPVVSTVELSKGRPKGIILFFISLTIPLFLHAVEGGAARALEAAAHGIEEEGAGVLGVGLERGAPAIAPAPSTQPLLRLPAPESLPPARVTDVADILGGPSQPFIAEIYAQNPHDISEIQMNKIIDRTAKNIQQKISAVKAEHGAQFDIAISNMRNIQRKFAQKYPNTRFIDQQALPHFDSLITSYQMLVQVRQIELAVQMRMRALQLLLEGTERVPANEFTQAIARRLEDEHPEYQHMEQTLAELQEEKAQLMTKIAKDIEIIKEGEIASRRFSPSPSLRREYEGLVDQHDLLIKNLNVHLEDLFLQDGHAMEQGLLKLSVYLQKEFPEQAQWVKDALDKGTPALQTAVQNLKRVRSWLADSDNFMTLVRSKLKDSPKDEYLITTLKNEQKRNINIRKALKERVKVVKMHEEGLAQTLSRGARIWKTISENKQGIFIGLGATLVGLPIIGGVFYLIFAGDDTSAPDSPEMKELKERLEGMGISVDEVTPGELGMLLQDIHALGQTVRSASDMQIKYWLGIIVGVPPVITPTEG